MTPPLIPHARSLSTAGSAAEPELHVLVDDAPDWIVAKIGELTRRAGVPMPEARVWTTAALEANVTGHEDPPEIVVSRSLLDCLAPDEIEAVLAHEIGHLTEDDAAELRFANRAEAAAISAGVAGSLAFLVVGFANGDGLLFLLGTIACLLGSRGLGHYAVAWRMRRNEYRADRIAAELTGNVDALCRALVKVDGLPTRGVRAFFARHIPEIARPFATHPPVHRRIRALRALERARRTRA